MIQLALHLFAHRPSDRKMQRVDGVEWRTIEHFPEMQVSEYGDVRHTHFAKSGHRKGQRINGWITTGGYRKFKIGGQEIMAHRLVCHAWHGPAPFIGAIVAHGDGDPTNNHFSNLRWATHKENSHDTIKHGRWNHGEKVPQAKLTEAQVVEIRERLGAGEEHHSLADVFGVRRRTITAISRGESWKHLGDKPVTWRNSGLCKRGHSRAGVPKGWPCRACQRLKRAELRLNLAPDPRLNSLRPIAWHLPSDRGDIR